MVQTCGQREIPCLLLTRPYVGSEQDPGRWKSYAPSYRRITEEVGAQRGVPVVDLYRAFEGRSELFDDEAHFDPRGHAIAATIVLRQVVRALLARGALTPSQARLFERTPPFYALVDVGTPRARAALQRGFSVDERVDERSAVWSEGSRSSLRLRLAPRDDPYELTIAARPLPAIAPLEVTVTVGGVAIGEMRFARGWQLRQLRIPAGRFVAGENAIDLRFGRTARPAAYDPASRDEREVALLLDRVTLVPAKNAGRPR
jgi:hypothetical protein